MVPPCSLISYCYCVSVSYGNIPPKFFWYCRALLYQKKHKTRWQSSHSTDNQQSWSTVVWWLLQSQVAQIHQIQAWCLVLVLLQKRLVNLVYRLDMFRFFRLFNTMLACILLSLNGKNEDSWTLVLFVRVWAVMYLTSWSWLCKWFLTRSNHG